MRTILAVGGPACINPLFTNGVIALTAAIVGGYAGTQALAGYATATRLEYLLIPLAFGLGGLAMHFTGSLTAFYVTGAVAMTVYELCIVKSVASGSWITRSSR